MQVNNLRMHGVGLSRMYGQTKGSMAMDLVGITVHTMNTVHRREPVFYASIPCWPRNTASTTVMLLTKQEADTISYPPCGIT